jgi:hypothetical protein
MLQILPNDFDASRRYKKYKGEDFKEKIRVLEASDVHQKMTKKGTDIDYNVLSWQVFGERKESSFFYYKVLEKKRCKVERLGLFL